MMSLDKYIDSAYKPEESLMLRYHKGIAFNNLSKYDFEAISLREGTKIYKLIDYKNVSIYIADESSLMSAGTFKTLEACLTMAICKKKKYSRVVFSSGANMGSALTIYGQKTGVETFFFHPESTSWKLNGSSFGPPTAHLISVDKPEKEVKKAALLFAALAGIPHVPEMEWRFLANGLRAFFVFEYMLKNCIQFDWISQAICAGYGPIGFYNTATKLMQEAIINKRNIPKLLGIQQENLSPIVKAWQNRHSKILFQDVISIPNELFVPNLYNTNPDSSYPLLYEHLLNFGGHLSTINKQEYENYLPLLLDKLTKIGINLTKRYLNGKDEILEKAGLLGLSGCLKSIDSGIIKEGETVLTFFTGGVGNHSGKQILPEYEIKKQNDLKKAVQNYLKIL